MISAVALGVCRNLSDAQQVFVRYGESFLPTDNFAAIYRDKFAKYKKLYDLLKEIN